MSALNNDLNNTPTPAATPPAATSPAATPPAATPPATPAMPPWMEGLPPELREGDAAQTLARYATPADVAKGLIETQKFARGRVALPDPADPASVVSFVERARPEKPEAYSFGLKEGETSNTAEAMRGVFFEAGVQTWQADRIAAGFNDFLAAETQKAAQAGKDELTALELELTTPAYQRRKQAAINMLQAMPGFEQEKAGAALEALERGAGARAAMELLFTLAERTGELEKVDPTDIALSGGTLTPAQARAEQDKMASDPAVFAKAQEKGTPEYNRWKQLNQIQAQARG
ncbi:MAG: hypothetical protein VKL39_17560 [Leptolyngbyaceae bacterium]|nr:hypothetical protein [Leptolyngbyaceae bacterium]